MSVKWKCLKLHVYTSQSTTFLFCLIPTQLYNCLLMLNQVLIATKTFFLKTQILCKTEKIINGSNIASSFFYCIIHYLPCFRMSTNFHQWYPFILFIILTVMSYLFLWWLVLRHMTLHFFAYTGRRMATWAAAIECESRVGQKLWSEWFSFFQHFAHCLHLRWILLIWSWYRGRCIYVFSLHLLSLYVVRLGKVVGESNLAFINRGKKQNEEVIQNYEISNFSKLGWWICYMYPLIRFFKFTFTFQCP